MHFKTTNIVNKQSSKRVLYFSDVILLNIKDLFLSNKKQPNQKKKRAMNFCKNGFITLLLMMLLLSSVAFSEGKTFALIGKSIDDNNFIDAWKGCDQAARLSGDRCELLGGSGDAQLRVQEMIIKKALASERFDALAISVISSDKVAKALNGANIPVITFDSPLDAKYKQLSHAYVGTDNMAFGRDLAKIAKKLYPNGKSICFMTVIHDPNLSLRILGARRELSGDNSFPKDKRLEGEGGWTEFKRCPWNASDESYRALTQLQYTLKMAELDIFLAVGHWPIIDLPGYSKIVELHQQKTEQKKPFIIIGIGSQSQPVLEQLMNDGLVHGFASIDFIEIGKKCYEIMKRITDGQSVEPINYAPYVIRINN